MEVYLDNSATTHCYPEVVEIMKKTMEEDYGNPSSKHLWGVRAEGYIRQAKQVISASLKCEEKELLFTSGGTESNNMAVIGAALANQRSGKHILVSSVEHPSVTEPMCFLEEQGFEVTYLPVDSAGRVDPETVKAALRSDTILVSMMYVNNEIGTVEPVEAVGKLVKEFNPAILFHVDAIQAYGKIKIVPRKLNIDLLSASGHKIHGPKGIGFLYIRDKVKIRPLIFGGGQQKGMRSGTENVPGIAGLSKAAELCMAGLNENAAHMYELWKQLTEGLRQMEGVHVNSPVEAQQCSCAPHIVSASFVGVRSEVLLHALEDRAIYVSSGSACASNKPAVSSTLAAIGLGKDLLDSAIRFSFCAENTAEQVQYTLDTLKELLPVLRKFVRS